MIKLFFGLSIALLVLSGCPTQVPTVELNKSHQLTTNEIKTLLGTDSDNNGIRDDIDSYINQFQLTEIPKKELNKFARTLQQSLLITKGDKEAATQTFIREMNISACFVNKLSDATKATEYLNTILNMISNTKLREQKRKNLSIGHTNNAVPHDNNFCY